MWRLPQAIPGKGILTGGIPPKTEMLQDPRPAAGAAEDVQSREMEIQCHELIRTMKS